MIYKYLFITFFILLFSNCKNESSFKEEKELLEKRVLEKRVLKNKLKKRKANKLNSNTNYSKSNSSNRNNKSDINETNIFSITVENDGFFDIEIPKYTVIIKRTADLNGKYVYDYERKDTHSNGFFGSDVVFYDAKYGYYTVEYFGFDKYDRKVFHKGFDNVLHKCHTVGTFYTNTDWNSPNVYCF